MITKQGRPRQLTFGTPGGVDPGFLLGFIDELVDRVGDQIVHLPPEALNFTGPNSTLSIGRLVLHLVSADLRVMGFLVTGAPTPTYADRLSGTTSADFASAPGDLSFAPDVLAQHRTYRQEHLVPPCRAHGFIDRPLDHPNFATGREVLGHMLWHWTYHSGQIGLVALEAGYDYDWTTQPRKV